MFKKIFILFLLLFLFGCADTVTNYEIDYYTNKCKDHGGLREIDKAFSMYNIATCQNGTYFEFDDK